MDTTALPTSSAPSSPLLPRPVPAIDALLPGADHVDVKTIDTDRPMRPFVAALLSYHPGWLRALYRLRSWIVPLLGLRSGAPAFAPMDPAAVPMEAGAAAAFFTVESAREDDHWIASASESHLTAHLGVVTERIGGRFRHHVITIVHHRSWAGPVYFAVIRPFHHLVVRAMMRAAAR